MFHFSISSTSCFVKWALHLKFVIGKHQFCKRNTCIYNQLVFLGKKQLKNCHNLDNKTNCKSNTTHDNKKLAGI